MKRIFVLLCLLSTTLIGYSQEYNPGEDEIFRNDEVSTIILFMSEEDKDYLFDEKNIWSDEYLPTSFRFINSLMDTTLTFDVGIRLRGNTSRYHPKKSLKLKFKEFDGEKFYDLKKFNLKAENNDPSCIRELMSLQTSRDFNIPAARSHHTKVYINDEYMGIYLNVEQLDDEFLESRFEYEDGNLYKCGYGATLESHNNLYDDSVYELKTNEDENDRSKLEHFVDVLNNTSDANFEEAISAIFNVDVFLRYLAMEALVGHWDGYSYNQNNYYLYENNSNGLMEFLPYDLDNTFGIDWVGGDWGKHDINDWAEDNRPLTNRILDVPSFYNQYNIYLNELMSTYFSEENYFPQFDHYKSMLSEPVKADTYYPRTFGFSHNDFLNSYTTKVINHAPYGLKPYITTRVEYAKKQLDLITDSDDMITHNTVLYPNPSNGTFINISSDIDKLYPPRIYDICGKEYFYTLVQNGADGYQLKFNQKLAPGCYILNSPDYQEAFIVK